MQDEWWKKKADEIETYTVTKNPEMVFNTIKEVYGQAPRRSCQLMAQPCLRRRAASTQSGGNTSEPCSTNPLLWTPQCSTRFHRSPSSPASTSPQRFMKFRRRSNRLARENPLGWTGFLPKSSSQPVQRPSKHSAHSSSASGKKRMSPKKSGMPHSSPYSGAVRMTASTTGASLSCPSLGRP